MTTSKQEKAIKEHPKYQHLTGVFPSDVGPKKSRKGENIRLCICPDCQKINLDDRIQNKCPRCDQWVMIQSITNKQGHLLGEICPECKRRVEEAMSIRFKYFTADNCPNCEASKKAIEAVRKLEIGFKEYKSSNADGLAEASYYGVQTTPTLILLNGPKEVNRWSGVIDKKKLTVELKGYFDAKDGRV